MPVSPVGAATPKAATDRSVARVIDQRLLTAPADKPVDAIVFFKPSQNGNVRSAASALAAAEALPLGPERKQLVFDSLHTIGQATLSENMPKLEALQKAGKVEGIDSLWSVNAVRLRGASLDAIKSIAGPNVRAIVPDEIIAAPTLPAVVEDPVKGTALIPMGKWQPSAKGVAPADPNAVWIDWGTKKMNAPAAWQQGITGAGITIASLDTGVITDHPGLKANYRGTKPDGTQDHNHNLHNAIEKGAEYPIDDVGHGTHTIGSAVGGNTNHLTAVAPDAKFIVSRGLGAAGGNLFGLMSAMEWMLAPTDLKGQNPRPDLAPDIVTNSWGGAPVSIPFLWVQLRNWRRAGIIPVFASGNDRKAQPGRVASPGMYGETITVGATEKDDSRAFFSMYGPSNFSKGHKPEVMAPGTKIYSAYPDGTFRDTFIIDGKEYPASGTSMATPHVAGAIALYMQANPGAKYDDILGALKKAGTLADKPTDEQGWGRVQVDRLITPETIDKNAKRTDPRRVEELMGAVAKAKVFGETPPAGDKPAGPATPQPAKAGAAA